MTRTSGCRLTAADNQGTHYFCAVTGLACRQTRHVGRSGSGIIATIAEKPRSANEGRINSNREAILLAPYDLGYRDLQNAISYAEWIAGLSKRGDSGL